MTSVKPETITTQAVPVQNVASTNVVVVDYTSLNRLREWQSGLFACFDDITSCLCVWCCTPFAVCEIASGIGESCWVPTCLPGGLMAMRTKLRLLNNIRGTICNDCCQLYWCGPCTLCQMARELKYEGTIHRQ